MAPGIPLSGGGKVEVLLWVLTPDTGPVHHFIPLQNRLQKFLWLEREREVVIRSEE